MEAWFWWYFTKIFVIAVKFGKSLYPSLTVPFFQVPLKYTVTRYCTCWVSLWLHFLIKNYSVLIWRKLIFKGGRKEGLPTFRLLKPTELEAMVRKSRQYNKHLHFSKVSLKLLFNFIHIKNFFVKHIGSLFFVSN